MLIEQNLHVILYETTKVIALSKLVPVHVNVRIIMEDYFVNAFGPLGNGKMWNTSGQSLLPPIQTTSLGSANNTNASTANNSGNVTPSSPNRLRANGDNEPFADVSVSCCGLYLTY